MRNFTLCLSLLIASTSVTTAFADGAQANDAVQSDSSILQPLFANPNTRPLVNGCTSDNLKLNPENNLGYHQTKLATAVEAKTRQAFVEAYREIMHKEPPPTMVGALDSGDKRIDDLLKAKLDRVLNPEEKKIFKTMQAPDNGDKASTPADSSESDEARIQLQSAVPFATCLCNNLRSMLGAQFTEPWIEGKMTDEQTKAFAGIEQSFEDADTVLEVSGEVPTSLGLSTRSCQEKYLRFSSVSADGNRNYQSCIDRVAKAQFNTINIVIAVSELSASDDADQKNAKKPDRAFNLKNSQSTADLCRQVLQDMKDGKVPASLEGQGDDESDSVPTGTTAAAPAAAAPQSGPLAH